MALQTNKFGTPLDGLPQCPVNLVESSLFNSFHIFNWHQQASSKFHLPVLEGHFVGTEIRGVAELKVRKTFEA